MKSKFLWGLLALSLVVNVAFLAGAFFLHEKAEDWRKFTLEERIEHMAAQLELSEEQKQLFYAIAEARENRRGKSWSEIRGQMSDLLLKEEVERDDFRVILDSDRANRTEDFVDRMMATHAFLWSLDEEKRQEIHEMMNDRDSAFRRAFRN